MTPNCPQCGNPMSWVSESEGYLGVPERTLWQCMFDGEILEINEWSQK